jgi:hypothetical protein
MTLFVALLLACGTSAAPEAPAPTGEHFGAEFTLTSSAPVGTVIADPEGHKGKNVRVVGEITQVCQKAGCWMVLRDDGGETMRITTKDHGYGVNKESAGRTAHVEGEVSVKAVDPERVAHFKSETDSKEAPEDGKTVTVEIDAAAVLIELKS